MPYGKGVKHILNAVTEGEVGVLIYVRSFEFEYDLSRRVEKLG